MLGFVRSVAVVGLGGIGSWFVPPFLRFLRAEGTENEILLVDGDVFAEHNRERQDVDAEGIGQPKAVVWAERMTLSLPGLRVRAVPEFVTRENVDRVVGDGSLAVVAVDNHPARALVASHAASLRDVCVLSAGNELYDGNAHVLLRRAARDLTVPLLDRHPEVARQREGDREEMGCEELVTEGVPQLVVTNFMAAAALLSAFHSLWAASDERRERRALVQEVYFDVREHAMSAVRTARPVRATARVAEAAHACRQSAPRPGFDRVDIERIVRNVIQDLGPPKR
jgi:molybdopterin/thiamine biosynthesis adenylyltransferase